VDYGHCRFRIDAKSIPPNWTPGINLTPGPMVTPLMKTGLTGDQDPSGFLTKSEQVKGAFCATAATGVSPARLSAARIDSD
jgi:hypothetical protein